MAQENLTEDDLEINLAYLEAIAQYFETGMQPDYLKMLEQEDDAAEIELDPEALQTD
ncbi:MAG: hypothetical protein AAFN12_08810 [Cyanobacteria bacterium J06560_2]